MLCWLLPSSPWHATRTLMAVIPHHRGVRVPVQGRAELQSPRNTVRKERRGERDLPRTGVSAVLPRRLCPANTGRHLAPAVRCTKLLPALSLSAGRCKSRSTAWKTPTGEVRLPGEGVMWKGKGCLAAQLGKDTTSTIVPAPRLPELHCPAIVPRSEGCKS